MIVWRAGRLCSSGNAATQAGVSAGRTLSSLMNIVTMPPPPSPPHHLAQDLEAVRHLLVEGFGHGARVGVGAADATGKDHVADLRGEGDRVVTVTDGRDVDAFALRHCNFSLSLARDGAGYESAPSIGQAT